MIFENFVYKILSGIGWRYEYEIVKKGQIGLTLGDRYLERFLKEFNISTVVDIGANGGQFVRRLRDDSMFSGTIHSYEPLPELFEELSRLSSQDDNWSIFPFAVDAASGKAVFNVMTGSEFSSMLKPSDKFYNSFGGQSRVEREISVDVLSLSEVANTAFQHDPKQHVLLKLDTQGTELRILSSCVDVVRRFVAVQVELSFQQIYRDSPDACEVINWMKNAGFELSSLFANNSGHFPHLLEMDGVFVRKELLETYKI